MGREKKPAHPKEKYFQLPIGQRVTFECTCGEENVPMVDALGRRRNAFDAGVTRAIYNPECMVHGQAPAT